MKKKLMMVTALMGLISFSACVDNNETQSVTNVRDAKAEQYQARADMNNAEAQAIQIMANADAALLNAKAKAAQANAAKAEAETATILKKKELVELQKAAATLENEAAQIENQKAQAALEEALSDLEVTKAEAEKELARIAAQLEADRLEWQAALLQAEKNLLVAQQQLQNELDNDPTAAEELQTLVTAYSTAVSNLVAAQQELAGAKADLVALEEDLVDTKEFKDEQIVSNNNSITLKELQIAKYKEYSNYTEEADLDALNNKYNELKSKNDLAYDAYCVLGEKYSDAQSKVDYEAVSEAETAIYDDAFYKWINNHTITLKDENGDDDVFYLDWEDCTMNLSYLMPNVTNYSYPGKQYSIDNEEYGTYSEFIGDSLVIDVSELDYDIRQIELAINENIDRWGGYLEGYKENLAKWQAQYDGKALYGTGEYDDEGNEIMKEGLNAVDSTAYLKKAYEAETDAAKKADLRRLYEAAISHEKDVLGKIKFYTQMVETYGRKVEAMKLHLAMFQNFEANKEAFQKLIDTRNEADVEAHADVVVAWEAKTNEYIKYLEINTEYKALNKVLYGYNGTEGANSIEDTIKQLEKEIADLKKANEDVSAIESQEQAIAYCNMTIEAWEAVVAARQVAVNEAKAALDEAMPATAE